MTETSESQNNDAESSGKRLVKILVVVFIGIPVLIELMTLFNIVNVQFFEEDTSESTVQEVSQVDQLAEGDTLWSEYNTPVLIENMIIKVRGSQWRFEMIFAASDTANLSSELVRVDSLKLQSEEILRSNQEGNWMTDEENAARLELEWELPAGDIPTILYLSSNQQVNSDSMETVFREAILDKIPVRYNTGDS